MDKLVTEKSQLPKEQQQAIEERLQVLYNKALLLYEQMPESFEAYIEKALKECNDTMREMIDKSSDVCNDIKVLSYIFVLHKERKKDLERLKDAFLQPQPEQYTEPQRGELLYYCQIAVKQGLLEKTETGYKRIKGKMSKAQLAYFLGCFFNSDGTFPETKYNKMFDESRLGKALYQISGNKNGGGKPRGYEIIDKLLLM